MDGWDTHYMACISAIDMYALCLIYNNLSIHDIHEYNDFTYWDGLSIMISDIGNGHQPWELRTRFAHYSKRRRFSQDWLQRRIEDVSRSITAYLISWKLDADLWLKIVINLNYYCRENIMERLISFSWMLTRIITWTTTRGSLSLRRMGEWLATTTPFGMRLWWPHLMHHWWTTLGLIGTSCWSSNMALTVDPRIEICQLPVGDGITLCRRISWTTHSTETWDQCLFHQRTIWVQISYSIVANFDSKKKKIVVK